MGDKWTTSGRSRLKAKQNRGLGGRGNDRTPKEMRPVFITNPHNYPTNHPKGHPSLRERYFTGDRTDPVARRAIIADGKSKASDRHSSDAHIGSQHIRNPNTRSRIISHYREMNSLPYALQQRGRSLDPSYTPYYDEQIASAGSTHVPPPFGHHVPNHSYGFAHHPTTLAYRPMSMTSDSDLPYRFSNPAIHIPHQATASHEALHFQPQHIHPMSYENEFHDQYHFQIQSHSQRNGIEMFRRHGSPLQRYDMITETSSDIPLNGSFRASMPFESWNSYEGSPSEPEIVTQPPCMDFSEKNPYNSGDEPAPANHGGLFLDCHDDSLLGQVFHETIPYDGQFAQDDGMEPIKPFSFQATSGGIVQFQQQTDGIEQFRQRRSGAPVDHNRRAHTFRPTSKAAPQNVPKDYGRSFIENHVPNEGHREVHQQHIQAQKKSDDEAQEKKLSDRPHEDDMMHSTLDVHLRYANPSNIHLRAASNDAVSLLSEPEPATNETLKYRNQTDNTTKVPIVRCAASLAEKSTLRFFNEGVEVDYDGNPLVSNHASGLRGDTFGGLPSSSIQNAATSSHLKLNSHDSDDDLDLTGYYSLWGKMQD